MFSRAACLVVLVCIVAAGAGYLVSAGTMPWPVPLAVIAVALVVGGVARARRGRASRRQALLADTEPAGVSPPPS